MHGVRGLSVSRFRFPGFPGLDAVGGNQTKTRREGRAAKPNLLVHINPGHTVTLGSRGVLINDHAGILKCSFCHLAKSKVTGLFLFVSGTAQGLV